MGQEIVVFVIVALAAAWAARRWMPARWRQAIAGRFGRLLQRLGASERAATRITGRIGKAPGCSTCDSCGGCAAPGRPTTEHPITIRRRN
ncbi:DUF6587 family protein [uncultured Xylophilus sp.]|uniref:DUF6587 family protein n=1 Tax=uncultured Xylophilus sp. TaxID=296832 RepID=UPI0025CC04FE|nr:DUF6587 family protein [uncultured Xylophilus sp.]